jgi:hypothetical protein
MITQMPAGRGLTGLTLALVTSAASSAPIDFPGSIRMYGGAVPIGDVTVSLTAVPPATGRRFTSAHQGSFAFKGVGPGSYELGVVRSGRPLFVERAQGGVIDLAPTLRVTIPAKSSSFRLPAIVAHDLGGRGGPAAADAARCLSMLAGRTPRHQVDRVAASLVVSERGTWRKMPLAGLAPAKGALLCIAEEREETGKYVTTRGRDAGNAVAYRWRVRLLRSDGRIVSTTVDAQPPEQIQVRTDRKGDVVDRRLDSPEAESHLRIEVEKWLKAAPR